MSLKTIVNGARFCVTIPMLVFAFYLVILYSNGFWLAMVGSEFLAVASCMLITSLLAWFASFPAFKAPTEKGKERGYLLYTGFLWLSFMFTCAIIYITRDSKKQQCTFWVNQFITANRNTFFIDTFNRTYASGGEQDYFVHQRTLEAHDFTICVFVISFVLYFVFILNYEEVLRRMPEQLLDPEFKLSSRPPRSESPAFQPVDEDVLHISTEDTQSHDAASVAKEVGAAAAAVAEAQTP